MRLYLVYVNSDIKQFKWVGSQADAASARAALNSGGVKRADIKTKEVEVPTNKAGLLEFLNKGQFHDDE